MLPTRSRAGCLAVALLVPLMLLSAGAGPASAARPHAARPHAAGPADASGLTIQAFIWDCVAFGDGVPDLTAVAGITVKRKDGSAVPLRLAGSSGADWQLQTDCDPVKGTNTLRAGDRIKITLTDATSKTFTIPDIVPYGDPGKGTIGGPRPAGGDFHVALRTCDGNETFECEVYTPSSWLPPQYVEADGRWTWTAPTFPIVGTSLKRTPLTGLDQIVVTWSSPSGEFYRVTHYDATFIARVGSPVVKGYGRIGRKVTVTLRSASGAVRATGSTTVKGAKGAWSVTLKQSGTKVKPRVGDVVSASNVTDGRVKLRKLGLTIDPDSPTLRGSCWSVRLWTFADPTLGVLGSGLTKVDGSFSVPFLTLPPAGKRFTVRCGQVPGAFQESTWSMPAS